MIDLDPGRLVWKVWPVNLRIINIRWYYGMDGSVIVGQKYWIWWPDRVRVVPTTRRHIPSCPHNPWHPFRPPTTTTRTRTRWRISIRYNHNINQCRLNKWLNRYTRNVRPYSFVRTSKRRRGLSYRTRTFNKLRQRCIPSTDCSYWIVSHRDVFGLTWRHSESIYSLRHHKRDGVVHPVPPLFVCQREPWNDCKNRYRIKKHHSVWVWNDGVLSWMLMSKKELLRIIPPCPPMRYVIFIKWR